LIKISYNFKETVDFQRQLLLKRKKEKRKRKRKRKRGSYEFEPLSLEKICGSINTII
jgi:CelD/BcsL family acetyltransferase involved in cellulose biosynthesis